jgi:predicted amidohydrolase
MKIGLAQIKPAKGNVPFNIERHKAFINLATQQQANMIVFPELSLTAYEPGLANKLAIHPEDNRLDDFQLLSNKHRIIIGVGIPTKSDTGTRISMILFQPDEPRQTYSKQFLHTDELPFFVNGGEQLVISAGNHKIAPAICYESLLPEHAAQAVTMRADIYVASVAKSASGIAKAMGHFPEIAKQYAMPVLMCNCVGHCDNFESAGSSAIWNKEGLLVAQLNETEEALLLFDTVTGTIL